MLSFLNAAQKTIQVSVESLSYLQNIRWRRKPRWMPVAKSKMFRVPTRPVVPTVEKEEVQRLYNNYKTQIKSIRRYLTAQYEIANRQAVAPEVLKKAFEEDFAKCNVINDAWNAEVEVGRKKRFAEELAENIKIAEDRLAERMKSREKSFMEAEAFVRSQKEIAHTFITAENVDEAIEKALSSQVDYNFAIHGTGEKIVGRNTKPNEESLQEVGIKQ